MDIAIVGENSIKIRGKQVTFVVDPDNGLPKTSADAVVFLGNLNDADTSRVIDSRIIINGPGSYEVEGAKISGTTTSKGILYRLSVDGINIILGRTAETKTDGFDECQVAMINTDGEFSESFVTGLEPKVVILYGGRKEDAAKALGAENAIPMPKITITKDKLPEKMEVVTLG